MLDLARSRSARSTAPGSSRTRLPWACRGKDQVGKIVVLHTAEKLLGAIRHHEAVMEGFGSVAEFQAYWERMHGSFDPNEPVWQITFALIHPDDYGLWEGGT
jgi:hypothetical protein